MADTINLGTGFESREKSNNKEEAMKGKTRREKNKHRSNIKLFMIY
jgi:hypothetical protein